MNEKLAANLILLREALLLGLSMDRRVFVSGGGGGGGCSLGSAESSVLPSRFAGRSAVTSANATTCSNNTNKQAHT